MNVVAMIGNVASEPELRHTSAGKAVCNFRIAVNRPGTETADFFTVIAWERQAEVVNEYLTTGRRVGVEGRLTYRTWEKEGQKRSTVEIIASRITLLGSRSDGEPAGAPGEPSPPTASDPATPDDIPF
jgi:single-strand DNA-binding protein